MAEFEAPTEYLVVTHDKFEFRIPVVDYVFNENDVWARILDGVARVGISDYMQQKLTDISYFEPPKTEVAVDQFGELGSVESAKAVVRDHFTGERHGGSGQSCGSRNPRLDQ